MGFFNDTYNGIMSQKTSADIAGFNPPNPGPIDMVLMKYFNQDPNDLHKLRQQRITNLQELEAAPVSKMLSQFTAEGNDADPSFTGAEWVKGMATTPALGGFVSEEEYENMRSGAAPGAKKGAMPSTVTGGNPKIAELLQNAELLAQKKGSTLHDLREIADSVNNGTAPPSMALARFLAEGGDKSTTQVKTLAELAKQNDEINRARGIQGWINAGGKSPDTVVEPRLRTVMASAPYGVTLEDLDKMTSISGVVPKWKTVDTGTGQGEQRQVVRFDERTGKEGPQVGGAWQPSAPKITNNMTYNGDRKGIESLVGQMPKYMEEANVAVDSNARIGKMIGLLGKGAGGARGYATATVAPMLELVGVRSQGMTDAQLYQRLASTLAGSLRMQVVGPGPVSNYEQDLLKKVSGGGSIGSDAAKELLQFYKQTNDRKIDVYNNTVDSIGAVAPETSKVYKRIAGGSAALPAGAKTVTGPNGQKGYYLNGKTYSMDGKEIR